MTAPSVITAVDTIVVRARLHTPFVTALRRTEYAETLAVRITDSEGRVGWGEAPQVWRVTGDSIIGSQAAIQGPLAQVVSGLGPVVARSVIQDCVVGNRAAKMAVDLACWDLIARAAGRPLASSLNFSGSNGRNDPANFSDVRVLTDMTLAAGSIDDLAHAAADRAADGFEVIKIKLGTDASTDIDRVLAVREAVGSGVILRVDANTGWDARQAVEVVTRLEDAGADLELVEQPTRARDLDALAWVRRHVSTPVMADESVFDLDDLVEVIRMDAVDGINIKLAKCGGLTPALEMARVARAHDLSVMVGCMMETHIGVGAAAALAANINPDGVNDLDATWWIESSPYAGGIRQDGPRLLLPDAAGSGIEGLVEQ